MRRSLFRNPLNPWQSYLLLVSLYATINFVHIFLWTLYARGLASSTHSADGFTVTVCYFGPPLAFYPRLFVASFIFAAALASLRRSLASRITSLTCLMAAVMVYLLWWIHSYRLLQEFSHLGIPFLSHSEGRQVAYLIGANWLDIFVAVSLCIAFVLTAERTLSRIFNVSSFSHSNRRDTPEVG
jgi:hypothetical protein